MKKSNRGFTLVELIVVIAILAILSVALIPVVNNLIEKSAISRLLSDTETVKKGLLIAQADIGGSFSGLTAGNAKIEDSFLVTDPGLNGWDGPYIENLSTHPFGGGSYGIDVFTIDPNDIVLDLRGPFTADGAAGGLKDKINLKVTGTTTPTPEQEVAITHGAASFGMMLLRDAN